MAWQSDADYLAAIRAANLDTAHGEADVRTRQGRLKRNLGNLLPEIARQGGFEREGVNTGWESRGLFRTGMRQDAIARQRYDEARRVADAQTSTWDEMGDLETSLARLRADANRRRTDAAYGAQQRSYLATQSEALRRAAAEREDALAREGWDRQEALWRELYGAKPAAPGPYTGPIAGDDIRRPNGPSLTAQIRPDFGAAPIRRPPRTITRYGVN